MRNNQIQSNERARSVPDEVWYLQMIALVWGVCLVCVLATVMTGTVVGFLTCNMKREQVLKEYTGFNVMVEWLPAAISKLEEQQSMTVMQSNENRSER